MHRLRQRYKTLVREQIAATVETPEDVEDEIRDLFAAQGRSMAGKAERKNFL